MYITIIFGTALYIAVGLISASVTVDHINGLCEKVAEYDARYCERLWYHITLKRSRIMEFVADVMYMVFWPIVCTAAILKAEREYDLIVHHSAFTNRTAR